MCTCVLIQALDCVHAHCIQYSVDTYEDILRDILGDRRMIDIGIHQNTIYMHTL
jgi:hypothetical protein